MGDSGGIYFAVLVYCVFTKINSDASDQPHYINNVAAGGVKD